jgi:hypothetical protein
MTLADVAQIAYTRTKHAQKGGQWSVALQAVEAVRDRLRARTPELTGGLPIRPARGMATIRDKMGHSL